MMIRTANIVGAGIGGLTAAIALAQRGVHVRVFEQAPELLEVGAGIQLSPNAMKVLIALGLGEALHEVAFEPNSAVIKNGHSGKAYVSVPLKGIASRVFGAPYYHIHRADLQAVLQNKALEAGVEIALNARVESYDEAGFSCVERADLSVGADGVGSVLSAQMNPDQPVQFTGQIAWRGAVPTAHLPTGLVPPDATVWSGSGKHIVTYYVRGGDLVNFVAVEEKSNWADTSWTSQGDLSDLQNVFDGWHSTITMLLAASTQVNIWALYDKPELKKWVDGSVALLGDAGHPTLPFMAQGAAMAIEDAYILAQCVAVKSTLNEALRTYEILRKPRTKMLQSKARKNADLFHSRGSFGGLLSKAKLNVARCLPSKLAMFPFNDIYKYDATKIDF
ncbi:FAD-dependent monooxygenase [Amylibacter sp.]|nr:FAD-dependent monooxygenase [Amylibacter sp.]